MSSSMVHVDVSNSYNVDIKVNTLTINLLTEAVTVSMYSGYNFDLKIISLKVNL